MISKKRGKMDFKEYQEKALSTAVYPDVGHNIIYPALKLAGEAGETADKIGKLWRNKNYTSGKQYSLEERIAVAKEMGDVLWYLAAISNEISMSLDEIADMNIKKLQDRRERGVVKGEGDNR